MTNYSIIIKGLEAIYGPVDFEIRINQNTELHNKEVVFIRKSDSNEYEKGTAWMQDIFQALLLSQKLFIKKNLTKKE